MLFTYLKCNADSSNLEAAKIICESLAISDTLFFYDSAILNRQQQRQQEMEKNKWGLCWDYVMFISCSTM
ncbi:CLUMA_CG009306, isoform A [Clunio marinus]|uniref:CLUMA_CG009306, isoform A n=1 Tax=Clunio marinus TaxID=568069 RepID=A0A1J1I6N7_9DIPT|nr:CLUMA_CG009306, isoform A [Clunio marinus]